MIQEFGKEITKVGIEENSKMRGILRNLDHMTVELMKIRQILNGEAENTVYFPPPAGYFKILQYQCFFLIFSNKHPPQLILFTCLTPDKGHVTHHHDDRQPI